MDRYYFAASFEEFKRTSDDEILGQLTRHSEFDVVMEQTYAWEEEFRVMRDVLAPYEHGEIVLEYSIPRLGKRIDVVAIIKGVIFVLEFKAGEVEYRRQNLEQVWDYALDLKNFHEDSHNRTIVPILVATNAETNSSFFQYSVYDDNVFEPILTNADALGEEIANVLLNCDLKEDDASNWIYSRYSPTPTIIEAASYMYSHHTVENITKSEASGESLKATTDYIINIIEQTKQNREKAICFVTGVPGAGKTLVGLNVAIHQFNEKEGNDKQDLAVYLSGNGPLVEVLTEALARDRKKQQEAANGGVKYPITTARREVRSFIQIIHHYRDNTLSKTKMDNGELVIDETKNRLHENDGYAEVEHVAIFDEAQRAWTKDYLASWLKRKKGVDDFPYSEPAFLIWSLNLRQDWALVVCLVGGGQEINSGEAGISEWIKALNDSFRDWKIYISDHLTDKEYAEGKVNEQLSASTNVTRSDLLHLSVSMRSFRAENLSAFVHHLLEMETEEAKRLYAEIDNRYPIVLTRDLDFAKKWLHSKARGTERFGVIVSSQAYRLRPLAIDVRVKPDTVHWFLDDENDIRSSLFLEDVATEFDVQGLELDWTCVVWDGDFRYSEDGWQNFKFNGGDKWNHINKEEAKLYQKNAYRVLLTRARQGMIICVPKGDSKDKTRLPEIYDSTYHYLKDQIGMKEEGE